MKPGGVVSLKRINSLLVFRNNKLFLFLCSMFVVGIFTGTVVLSDSQKIVKFAEYVFKSYIDDRAEVRFFSILMSSFFKEFSVCIAMFILGASVIGVVLSPTICCSLGIYYGFLSSYIYRTFALKGVAFNAIILIPAALSFVVCMLFAARQSFAFSVVLLKLTLPKSRPLNISVDFKIYCGKYLLVCAFLIVSSLIDAVVSSSFLKLFNF